MAPSGSSTTVNSATRRLRVLSRQLGMRTGQKRQTYRKKQMATKCHVRIVQNFFENCQAERYLIFFVDKLKVLRLLMFAFCVFKIASLDTFFKVEKKI